MFDSNSSQGRRYELIIHTGNECMYILATILKDKCNSGWSSNEEDIRTCM